MFDRFLSEIGILPDESILDVGVTSDQTYEASNYLEAWYPHKSTVTAAGLDDASFLCRQYPGMRFVRANGLTLPFRDQSFDIVHSSAVIEHVGSFTRQRAFGRMLPCRTPGRLRHHAELLVPDRISYRAAVGALAAERCISRVDAPHRPRIFRRGSEFKPVDPRGSRKAAGGVAGFDSKLSYVSLAGWPSNILLAIRRRLVADPV